MAKVEVLEEMSTPEESPKVRSSVKLRRLFEPLFVILSVVPFDLCVRQKHQKKRYVNVTFHP
jgi:hypothetical protein